MQAPKFHLSVASLLYRESLVPDVIIEVPIRLQATETTNASNTSKVEGKADIYQFANKYCVSDSSEDEEEKVINPTIHIGNKSTLNINKSSSSSRGNETLTCSVIECSIGNRTFQFSVHNDASRRAEFVEILEDKSSRQRTKYSESS